VAAIKSKIRRTMPRRLSRTCPAAAQTVIKAGRLVDGSIAAGPANVAILVEGERIKAGRPRSRQIQAQAPNAAVIDLSQMTVLPRA